MEGPLPKWIHALRLLPVLRRIRRHVESFYAVAGLYLSLALAVSLAGLLGLTVLTEEVMEGETLRFDEAVLRWLDSHATAGLDRAALEVTALGDTLVVLTIAVVAGTILVLLERRAYAGLIAAAVAGAWVVYPVMKLVFDRPRPRVFEWRTDSAALSSYPSGHATMSMVLFLVLAYVIHRLAGRGWIGWVSGVTAGVLVLLIGASRLYLGVHYPSDVLAGYVVGLAWTTFCAVGVEVLPRLREATDPWAAESAAADPNRNPERGSS